MPDKGKRISDPPSPVFHTQSCLCLGLRVDGSLPLSLNQLRQLGIRFDKTHRFYPAWPTCPCFLFQFYLCTQRVNDIIHGGFQQHVAHFPRLLSMHNPFMASLLPEPEYINNLAMENIERLEKI